MSDFRHDRLLAPAALVCLIEWCGKCASRIFHTTYSIVCAAKLREHPVRESEESENQTRSQKDKMECQVMRASPASILPVRTQLDTSMTGEREEKRWKLHKNEAFGVTCYR